MSTVTVLIVILFAIGAAQGVVFGLILLRSKRQNALVNRLLAAILFLLSYRLTVQTLRLFGLGYYDEWYYITLDFSWINGALLYFYVKAQLIPNFRIRRTDGIHFLPVVIQVGFSIFVRLQNIYWDGTRESLSWLGYWGYVVWMNYATIYIVASFLIVIYALKSQRLLNAPDHTVAIDPKRIVWLKTIILSFKVYFALVLAVLLTDLLIYNVTLGKAYFYFERFYYYPFFAGISILTYWIGIEGFKRKDSRGLTPKQELSLTKRHQLEEIAASLNRLMEEDQLYKNPDLSLRMVADHLQVKPYLLSNCLREILNSRFNDYVNAFRVDEVKRLLKAPENNKYTLLSLAMHAGFNSKSSFNRSVKKHLGISPSELKTSG